MSALRRAVVCAPTRRRVLLEALFVCTKATQRECKSAGALHHVFRRTSLIKVPALFLVRSFESFHGLPGVAGSKRQPQYMNAMIIFSGGAVKVRGHPPARRAECARADEVSRAEDPSAATKP